MSAEAGYRTALRWYPRAWRRANEEVMIGTLLDGAEAQGRDAPSRDELRDLRRSGLAARADVILPGRIRDRVAAISLGAGAGMALILITGQAWAPWTSQGSPAEAEPAGLVWQLLVHPGLWLLAALAALLGSTVVARLLLIATLPSSLIVLMATDVAFLLRPSLFTLVMMGVLALLACIGRPLRAWVLVAAAIMVAAFASWVAFLGPFPGTYFPRGGLIDTIASPLPAALFLMAAVAFAVRARRIDAAGVVAAATPWLVLLIGDALWLGGFGGGIGYLVRTGVIAAIAIVIPVAILLVVRRYARPPWLSPSESSDSPTSASRPSSTR